MRHQEALNETWAVWELHLIPDLIYLDLDECSNIVHVRSSRVCVGGFFRTACFQGAGHMQGACWQKSVEQGWAVLVQGNPEP